MARFRCNPAIALTLLAIASPSNAAPRTLTPAQFCEAPLRSDRRFLNGEITHLGQTPKEFFTQPLAPSGQPRLVLAIGMPGSGKSVWAAAASADKWDIINHDKIRRQLVSDMRNHGELIQGELADPERSDHIFCESMRREGQEVGRQQLHLSLERRHPILLDALNLTPSRAAILQKARTLGYFTEALFFDAPSEAVIAANIRHRTKNGGLSVTPSSITNLWTSYQLYNATLSEVPELPQATITDTPLDERTPQFRSQSSDQREQWSDYDQENVFHRISIVHVRDYSE